MPNQNNRSPCAVHHLRLLEPVNLAQHNRTAHHNLHQKRQHIDLRELPLTHYDALIRKQASPQQTRQRTSKRVAKRPDITAHSDTVDGSKQHPPVALYMHTVHELWIPHDLDQNDRGPNVCPCQWAEESRADEAEEKHGRGWRCARPSEPDCEDADPAALAEAAD